MALRTSRNVHLYIVIRYTCDNLNIYINLSNVKVKIYICGPIAVESWLTGDDASPSKSLIALEIPGDFLKSVERTASHPS